MDRDSMRALLVDTAKALEEIAAEPQAVIDTTWEAPEPYQRDAKREPCGCTEITITRKVGDTVLTAICDQGKQTQVNIAHAVLMSDNGAKVFEHVATVLARDHALDVSDTLAQMTRAAKINPGDTVQLKVRGER